MTETLGSQSEFVADTPTAVAGASTEREMRLAMEVARLEAEIADLRGSGSVEATSRFLAMATDTIDQAMDEARQEAERARADAAELTASALADVIAMKSLAEAEAVSQVDLERGRVADEIEALQEVRGVLESKRHDLEIYHAELRRRVQDLSESMVSFFAAEEPVPPVPPIDGTPASEPGGTSSLPSPWAPERDPVAEFAGAPTQNQETGLDDVSEDDRFQAFIGGDEAPDKSRDWLLRPESD